MSVVIRRSEEAIQQYRALPPTPKRRVKEALRQLALDPFGPETLEMATRELTYRVRTGNYRIVFQPGPTEDEILVIRIAPRSVAYEGFERPSIDV